MLNQANYWIEIAAAVVDALLLLRFLLLKLQKTYFFIFLVCVLTVFFDVITLWLGIQSQEAGRVTFYSRFLYVFLYPAAAWDVFEEIRAQIAKVRRLAIFRLVSSVFMATIFGLLFIAFADTSGDGGREAVITLLGLVLWAASAVASLAFLLTLHRETRKQKITLPNNTFVWLVFFELLMAVEVLVCVAALALPLLNSRVEDVADICFNTYGILITIWCVWRLRAVVSDLPSASEKASL